MTSYGEEYIEGFHDDEYMHDEDKHNEENIFVAESKRELKESIGYYPIILTTEERDIEGYHKKREKHYYNFSSNGYHTYVMNKKDKVYDRMIEGSFLSKIKGCVNMITVEEELERIKLTGQLKHFANKVKDTFKEENYSGKPDYMERFGEYIKLFITYVLRGTSTEIEHEGDDHIRRIVKEVVDDSIGVYLQSMISEGVNSGKNWEPLETLGDKCLWHYFTFFLGTKGVEDPDKMTHLHQYYMSAPGQSEISKKMGLTKFAVTGRNNITLKQSVDIFEAIIGAVENVNEAMIRSDWSSEDITTLLPGTLTSRVCMWLFNGFEINLSMSKPARTALQEIGLIFNNRHGESRKKKGIKQVKTESEYKISVCDAVAENISKYLNAVVNGNNTTPEEVVKALSLRIKFHDSTAIDYDYKGTIRKKTMYIQMQAVKRLVDIGLTPQVISRKQSEMAMHEWSDEQRNRFYKISESFTDFLIRDRLMYPFAYPPIQDKFWIIKYTKNNIAREVTSQFCKGDKNNHINVVLDALQASSR